MWLDILLLLRKRKSLLFLTSPSDRSRSQTENITSVDFQSSGSLTQFESIKPTNKGFPLYYNESQTELYLEYIKVLFLFLSNDFHEVFAYNEKHDQRKRRGQDENESSIRDYEQAIDTRWHLLQGKYKWQKV